MTRRRFLQLLGSAGACTQVWARVALAQGARVWVVAEGGSDRALGSVAEPWATLTKAVARARSGDRILVRGGRYREAGLVIDRVAGLSIAAYPGERPVVELHGELEYSILMGEHADSVSLDRLILIRNVVRTGNVVGLGGTRNVLRGCTIRFQKKNRADRYDAVKVLGDDMLIEHCLISDAPNQGIDAVGRRGLTIRSNIIHRCANAIVVKGGSRDVLIENNRCFNHRHGAIGVGGTTDPRWHNHANSDAEAEAVTVRRNIIYYDHPYGIGGGIFLRGAKHCKVVHNTVYGAGIHIAAGGDPENLNHHSRDNEVSNNIIWSTGDDGLVVIDAGNDQGLVLRNNLYWRTTGGGEFKLHGRWMSYRDYRESAAYDQGSLYSDPNFVDVAGRNFALRPDSPALGPAIR